MPAKADPMDQAQLFAILGATASGKSALAIDIARQRRAAGRATEIVAVDAFTVYQGMDIGTAKPSQAIRDEIPHHMIDIYTPDHDLTVAAFQQMARNVIDERRARGIDLILVGGSGLYWRAVVDDLRFPPTDAAVRQALEEAYPCAESAYQQLQQADQEAATQIAPNNHRRIIRALEVGELTGQSFAAFARQWEQFVSRYDGLTVGYLEPETAELHAQIAVRTKTMLSDGLLDEARQLRANWSLSRTAAQGIGYAEAFAVLDGQAPLATLEDTIAQRTRRYARRQRTWFRRDPRCVAMNRQTLFAQWCVSKGVSHA